MKQPSVLIVTPGSFAIPSRRKSSVELVVQQLSRRVRSKVRLTIAGRLGRWQRRRELRRGIRYVRFPAFSRMRYLQGVVRQAVRMKPQLIQVENRPRYVRYLRYKCPKALIWLVLHSTTFVTGPYIRSSAELRSCLMAADRIFVNSHFLKEQLTRMAPYIAERITVNHLGVDLNQFTSRWSPEGEAKRQEMLQKLGYEGRRIILFVGRLIPIKGVHHILRAMPELISAVPDALLLIVGSPSYGSARPTPYSRELKRMAGEFPEHVRFIPFVPHSEIADYYRLADAMVVPSGEKEAFGLVNVEAMASGVPVVATRAGGMKEIIKSGKTGWLISPKLLDRNLAPTLIELLLDSEGSRRMGEAGILHVREHFTWERMAERWLDWVVHDVKRRY